MARKPPHPHFDLYCREHEVRIGGCRCASPEKLKQYADCPGEACPGFAPTPKQREEREDLHATRWSIMSAYLADKVMKGDNVEFAKAMLDFMAKVEEQLPNSIRTHSPEEPVVGECRRCEDLADYFEMAETQEEVYHPFIGHHPGSFCLVCGNLAASPWHTPPEPDPIGEPVGEIDWNRCVLVTQGLDAGNPDAIAIEVANHGEWEGASGHHHLDGWELIDAWVLAQALGWPLVAVPHESYRCTPDNPPDPIGQPLDGEEGDGGDE